MPFRVETEAEVKIIVECPDWQCEAKVAESDGRERRRDLVRYARLPDCDYLISWKPSSFAALRSKVWVIPDPRF
jgi:hypothetical protein